MVDDTEPGVEDTPSAWMRIAAIGFAVCGCSLLLAEPLHTIVLGFGIVVVCGGLLLAGVRWFLTRKR